jgi:hypothetical protein
MNYHIDRHGRLVLTASEKDRAYLNQLRDEDPDEFQRDRVMYDVLEWIVTNDEFQFISPYYTGDMTDAPMLGLLGEQEEAPEGELLGSGLVDDGRCDGKNFVRPIIYRWAYMNYAVGSPQEDLLEKGKCIWEGGDFLHREGQMFLEVTV